MELQNNKFCLSFCVTHLLVSFCHWLSISRFWIYLTTSKTAEILCLLLSHLTDNDHWGASHFWIINPRSCPKGEIQVKLVIISKIHCGPNCKTNRRSNLGLNQSGAVVHISWNYPVLTWPAPTNLYKSIKIRIGNILNQLVAKNWPNLMNYQVIVWVTQT